ncbi:filamentous hemagglutinin N-terminal domain-containing protein [uncultured Phascolarctobacterium sp.]|uniref:filamentous hemagglutinin N-terminal domain-containing protein n=1 Tax=uncultured Phascolarctobacterium sp. TaxID=512296 RepID=UPI00262A3A69|nr:filamentous hemagglutinin N-terminal domain-containing protein [uncultured Phascolarctobacterium sp.]
MKKSKRLNHYIRLACLTGALFCYSASAFAVVLPNIQLPENGKWIMGGSGIINEGGTGTFNNNTMNISQNGENAVIKWGKFSIGSIATVNFERQGGGNFNILNYDAGGQMSQIRGTLKAENGNVYIVNPAGVFIGNSAQVDVGSLYVSNKKIAALEAEEPKLASNTNINELFNSGVPATSAELMSLGHINASKVEFVGDRIVLDTELLTTGGLEHKMAAKDILIKTNSKDNVVIGYNAYNSGKKADGTTIIGYEGQNPDEKVDANKIATINNTGEFLYKSDGYMWVRDLEQLQAINTNLSGNYALRNGIGAISTKDNNFTPIGSEREAFTGKFDGLAGNVDGIDFAIFDLHVTGNDTIGQNNLGLFGVTDGAEIRNVLLTGGEVTGTGNNIGALVGLAKNTTIENVRNSINVSGNGTADTPSQNVGGIVGSATGATKISDILNTGDIKGFTNVGGVVGSINTSVSKDESGNDIPPAENADRASISNAENIGRVQGVNTNTTTYSHDIGGIAGSAKYADISDVENNLQIVGGYNVGGIVGSGENVTIKGAVNNADVTANGYTTGYYYYNSDVQNESNLNIKNYVGTINDIHVANAGGIIGKANNSTIGTDSKTASMQETDTAVINYGNVKSVMQSTGNYYIAGNVGGIAGRAEDTNIYNVENKENEIFGAHNVGGVVGYFLHNSAATGTKFVVSGAVNNGGEIMATGARDAAGFVKEKIRKLYDESANIGNIGGIVGYMYGDNTYITGAANRGNVHSFEDFNGDTIPDSAQAANVGGVVGKINRSNYIDGELNDKYIKDINSKIEGKLSEIKVGTDIAAGTDSYNTGEIHGYTGVGGIAGMIYNGEIVKSYNLGNLRSSYKLKTTGTGENKEAINMGGIVGDTTEEGNARAILYDVYNKGTIGDSDYNYYGRHVGGVVGRLSGTIDKAYNNGAVYNASNATGGIVGWWYAGNISNVFNTGNITVNHKTPNGSRVGGIVGGVSNKSANILNNAYNLGVLRSFAFGSDKTNTNQLGGIIGWQGGKGSNDLKIDNVYTMGNLYSIDKNNNNVVHAIIGAYGADTKASINNAYYIAPGNTAFTTISEKVGNDPNPQLDGAKWIAYYDRYNPASWNTGKNDIKLDFGTKPDGATDVSDVSAWNKGDWRMYTFADGTGTMPILNAFVSSAASWQGNENEGWMLASANYDVQYGNAYDPLRTIISYKGTTDDTSSYPNLNLDWSKMHLGRNESLAVLNSGLTLNNFANANAKTYYGGLIFADGALTIKGKENTDIRFSQAANIYGSSVNITAKNGDILDYGNIIAHGKQGDNSITISGKNVEILGTTKSLKSGETLPVYVSKAAGPLTFTNVNNSGEAMPDYATAYTYDVKAKGDITGDITITADENLEVLLGQRKQGLLSSNGDISLTGGKSVYVDSDIELKNSGKMTIKSDGEALLDISNIKKLDDFLTQSSNLSFTYKNSNNKADAIIALTNWEKYTDIADKLGANKDKLHNWVSDAAQLKNITGDSLKHNFALKNNIDAAEVKDFEAIGGETGFSGKFNGRNNTVVGLTVDNDANAGLFSKVGTNGKVSNLKIYSSHFTGSSVGAVAGVNNGTIDNITTFGNRVNSDAGTNNQAGGIAGSNLGTISNVALNDAVAVSKSGGAAGGIAGSNSGTIKDSVANTNVTAMADKAKAIGGIVGVNIGTDAIVNTVRSLGIVNGTYKDTIITNNVGGIAGINEGGAQITKAYNVAHVSGGSNVGGIVGKLEGSNTEVYDKDTEEKRKKYDLQEVVSAGDVTSKGTNAKNVGGIVGSIENKNEENNKTYTYINSGRNTGEINGNENVGGLVGNNGVGSNLQNVINDANATITGETNVGGIAGYNEGVIDSELTKLVNDGLVYGQTNVGGVAGKNTGTIRKTNSNITLYVKNTGALAQYFGGAVGYNLGIINDAFNSGTIKADGATYVGGIVGYNAVEGNLVGTINGAENRNTGIVIGDNYVGGIAGYNKGNINGTATDPTIVQNFGFVHAEHGSAGGVVGVNDVQLDEYNENRIRFASLINSGIVAGNGKDGTGGVIGVNHGNITEASLIGTVDATVVGEGNVGGLIGINYGKVVGGRDAGGNYYAQQIYNNGKVIGGTTEFVDTLPDNSGANEWKEIGEPGNIKGYYKINAKTDSTNIGGLIGSNDVQTVGDITKTGSLTAGYNTGVVTGGTNVGDVVGNNATYTDADGKVFNAKVDQVFNAGTVEGTAAVGKVVGNNNGTVTNAYDVDSDLKGIIGKGNPVGEETEGFWTTYGDGKTAGKENYGTNKLLSVFLTKINFVPEYENAFKDFVYNAHKQSIIVKAEKTSDGQDIVNVYKNDGLGNTNSETLLGHFVNASNNLGDDANAAHSLADFINTQITTGDDKGIGGLLSGTSFTDAGTYNIFNTKQIDVKGNNGSPNNLGFDVTDIKADNNTHIDKVEVNKAQISLTLDEIWRIYGDATIDNKTAEAFNHIFGGNGTKDYGFTINGNNVSINKKLVDQLMSGVLKVGTITDDAVDNLDEGKTTNNVGTYAWSLKATLNSKNLASNNFELVSGDNTTFNGEYTGKDKSHVTKAALTFTVNDKEMTAGGSKPFFDGSYEGLVNGDTETTVKFGGYELYSKVNTTIAGVYADRIGVLIDGELYFANDENVLKNYNLIINPGTLTVSDLDPTDPTNPDNPYSPDNPNNWQAEDKYPWYQWDKQRNESERKAEVHFVDGGMHVEA